MSREIVVQGEAEATAAPNLAELRVAVDGQGDTRESAYTEAARAAAAVDEVIRAEEASIRKAVTAALVVQPRTRFRKGENVRTGWQAQRLSVLEVRALDRLGELVSLLVGAGANISGPRWGLDPTNEVHDRARREAAADARRRAAEYATALGLELGPVAWIAEPGLRAGGGAPHRVGWSAAANFARASAAETDEPVEIAPGEITVTAAVEVGFEIA